MLVACPQCRTPIRLTDFSAEERVVPYLCGRCGAIVRLDLVVDEIPSTTSASSFKNLRRAHTVLLACEEAAQRRVAAGILEDAGFEVETATDGLEALESLRRRRPDLLLVDLMLKGMNAVDLLRWRQGEPRLRHLPVLVTSGVYKADVLRYLQQLGAAGFLDRHHLVETLAFRVRACLGDAVGALAPPPGTYRTSRI